VEECIVQHAWKPRTMLACGAKVHIVSDGDVGAVVHVHLETKP
jgi:fructose-1,6-bisphosphatase/sedoheptulose 1,7-bisphosphatase-like protein